MEAYSGDSGRYIHETYHHPLQESLALGIGLMSRELVVYVVCVVGNAQGGVCRGCCRLCERLMCVCRCA